MENPGLCKSCQKRTLVADDDSGNLVCSSCGVVQDFVNFQAHIGGINGPTGIFVRMGTAGSGSVYSYKQTKVYEGQKMVQDLTFKLGLSGWRCDEVKAMVERITEGEYGSGRWFPIFVGACAYVVMRKDMKALPVVEVADLVGCDSNELGRMIQRVLDFLELKLPEFDIVSSFEREVGSCSSFSGISEEVIGQMRKQGVFLIQCSMKWYLTTGRRPIPIVAAVLVFVGELNQVKVKMEEVAQELHVALHTCKKRYRELMDRLVKVAQALPWGKDVTVKNILKNAPFLIQYMELKSTSKCCEKVSFEHFRFDLDDLVDDCLKKEIQYGDDNSVAEHDSKYFEAKDSSVLAIEGPSELKISHECLSLIYSKFLDEFPVMKSAAERGKDNRKKQNGGYDIQACREWWTGKSQMSKKLMLKQILEKDVGLNADPPSFDRGRLADQRRREKISAAKSRVQTIMHPSEVGPVVGISDIVPASVNVGQKRKMQIGMDWEDFIIETLLLHGVEEGEIEKGHYNVLLDLHVFNHLT